MSHHRKLKDAKKKIKLRKEIQMSITNADSGHRPDCDHRDRYYHSIDKFLKDLEEVQKEIKMN
jgi:hypothetical protein